MFSNLNIERDYMKLDKFHNHNFAHGIEDRKTICDRVEEIGKELEG